MIAGVVGGNELRALMGRFPAGVAVVTVDLDGKRAGLTVASLVSLSLEPPLVGVAIRRDAALHELLREAGRFAVSMLAAGQEGLAQHFARGVPPLLHWRGIETLEGTVAPLVEGAVGWLECTVAAEHAVGDHVLLVGDVVTASPGAPGPALAYRGQAYAAL